jgi:hypothetical protein
VAGSAAGWKGTWFPIVADPDPSSPHPLRRAEQARAQSEALRVQVAKVAEAVAEVEQEVARAHEDLADQGGSLAEQAKEYANRAREVAANEHAEAERLRRAKLGLDRLLRELTRR